MSNLSTNIRYLRKQKGLTQEQLAQQIGIKRAMVGAYEEGRSEPRLTTLQVLCQFFKIRMDQLVLRDLTHEKAEEEVDVKGQKLRILPIPVSEDEKELGTLVPVKASAGYLNGYGDADYVGALPKFSLPFPELPQDRTYRTFQIRGDSMLPVPPGAYIISEYVQDWNSIRNEECYVLITRDEGVVYKRVINNMNEGQLLLKSDNPDYDAYTMPIGRVVEVWKAKGVVSFELPNPERQPGLPQITALLTELKKDVEALKSPSNLPKGEA
jgi:transcriptional regulator with XRE-family HTH domain